MTFRVPFRRDGFRKKRKDKRKLYTQEGNVLESKKKVSEIPHGLCYYCLWLLCTTSQRIITISTLLPLPPFPFPTCIISTGRKENKRAEKNIFLSRNEKSSGSCSSSASSLPPRKREEKKTAEERRKQKKSRNEKYRSSK